MSAEEDNMVVEKTEEELEKEKLEAARKKLEKLQKKKNKNKKKNKGAKGDEANDASKQDSKESEEDTKESTIEEPKETNDDIKEDTKEGAIEEPKETNDGIKEDTKESTIEEPKETNDGIKEVKKDVTEEYEVNAQESTESKKEPENATNDKMHELFGDDESANGKEEDIFGNLDPNAEFPRSEKSEQNKYPDVSVQDLDKSKHTEGSPVDICINHSEKSKDQIIEELRKQLAESNLDIQKYKKEISSLKFERMDLTEEIETLKETIEELQQQQNKQNHPLSSNSNGVNMYTPQYYNQFHEQHHIGTSDSEEVSLSPPKPHASQNNYYQQQAQQKYNSYQPKNFRSEDEIRKELENYKNWNLDMRTWRSVGAGPIVEI